MGRLFEEVDFGDICRSAVDRPLTDNKTSLFSGNETADAYGTTTVAWDMFEPMHE